MSVVSNTSPLRYLIAIGQADLVQQIFGQVLISRGVQEELTHRSCPEMVRQWMVHTPEWLEIRDLAQPPEPELARILDQGEAQAIQLAIDLKADYLLMDERRGRLIASARGLTVIGTLGILIESHRQNHIENPSEVLDDLRAVGFRVSRRLVQEFERLIQSTKFPE
jgi:predicted nucleic acid-binding protein